MARLVERSNPSPRARSPRPLSSCPIISTPRDPSFRVSPSFATRSPRSFVMRAPSSVRIFHPIRTSSPSSGSCHSIPGSVAIGRRVGTGSSPRAFPPMAPSHGNVVPMPVKVFPHGSREGTIDSMPASFDERPEPRIVDPPGIIGPLENGCVRFECSSRTSSVIAPFEISW